MRGADFIQALRASRGKPTGFLSNFLSNFSEAAILMHKVLGPFQAKPHVRAQAGRGYLISMASCLETFYRDVVVYVLGKDEESLASILQDLREKATLAELHQVFRESVSFPEIAASRVTFQSLAEIETVMSRVFRPDGYLGALDKFELECLNPSKGRARLRLGELFPDWRTSLERIFRERHALVHDANLQFSISDSDMASLEAVALLIPQLTAELLATRYGKEGTLRVEGEPSVRDLPVLLFISEVISENWETTDDGGIRCQS
jgi:hypothetical protein